MAALIRRGLGEEGLVVDVTERGEDALWMAGSTDYDAVVLDVLLPGLSGLDVVRRLRAEGQRVPVLMLTARGAVDDRVAGLDAGADDYLVKPFALKELLARLRALLRRRAADGAQPLVFGDLELDVGSREVTRGGRRIELTRTEFNLLELFLRNPRQVLRRPVIYDRVWGYDLDADTHALEVYIGYLRRKLEQDGEPRLLHTVRGVGYALREP
jgi:two-component system, OmpR family, response regulator MprA